MLYLKNIFQKLFRTEQHPRDTQINESHRHIKLQQECQQHQQVQQQINKLFFPKHEGEVAVAAWNSKSNICVVAHYDLMAITTISENQIKSTENIEQIQGIGEKTPSSITSITFLNQINEFVFGTSMGEMQFWRDLGTSSLGWKRQYIISQAHRSSVCSLLVSKYDEFILSGDIDGETKIWIQSCVSQQWNCQQQLSFSSRAIYQMCLNKSESFLIQTNICSTIILNRKQDKKWKKLQIIQNTYSVPYFINDDIVFIRDDTILIFALKQRNQVFEKLNQQKITRRVNGGKIIQKFLFVYLEDYPEGIRIFNYDEKNHQFQFIHDIRQRLRGVYKIFQAEISENRQYLIIINTQAQNTLRVLEMMSILLRF